MIRSSLFSRSALGLALALGLAGGSLALSAPALAKDKKEKAPAKVSNSKEFVAAYLPLQATLKVAEDLKAKKAPADQIKASLAGAEPQLAAAEAQIKTAADRLAAGQAGFSIGQLGGDSKIMLRGLNNMLDSGQLTGNSLDQVSYYVGSFSYDDKNYARAIQALTPLVQGNRGDDSAAEILAASLHANGQTALALDTLDAAVKARQAAGGAVPNRWLERGVRIAFDAKLNDRVNDFARRRAEFTPNAFNWISAAQILRETGNYTDQESIDLSRLLFRAGALAAKSRETPREYVEYLQAATGRVGILYPGEAIKVAEAGIANGSLNPKDVFVADALSQSRARLAKDKADIVTLERDARLASAKPVTVMAAGDAYLSYDQPAKAEELLRMALTRPGVDMPRVLTRLGIALADQGKTAEAIETFGKVQGPRKQLAQLWAMYLTKKSAPVTAAATPAT